MSLKAARGLKRLCPSCASKFYDLNRDPIICPMCGSIYEQDIPSRMSRNTVEDDIEEIDDEDAIVDVVAPEIDEPEGPVTAEAEAEALEEEALPAGVEDEAELPDADDDAFLEEDEEEGGEGVATIIGGGVGEEEV